MIHNGPYIAACAEKLGRELTKDEHIQALEILAHDAQEDVAKLRRTLEMVLASARPHPMENGQMYHAWEEARKVLDNTLASESQREAAAKADEKPDGQAENENCPSVDAKGKANGH